MYRIWSLWLLSSFCRRFQTFYPPLPLAWSLWFGATSNCVRRERQDICLLYHVTFFFLIRDLSVSGKRRMKLQSNRLRLRKKTTPRQMITQIGQRSQESTVYFVLISVQPSLFWLESALWSAAKKDEALGLWKANVRGASVDLQGPGRNLYSGRFAPTSLTQRAEKPYF